MKGRLLTEEELYLAFVEVKLRMDGAGLAGEKATTEVNKALRVQAVLLHRELFAKVKDFTFGTKDNSNFDSEQDEARRAYGQDRCREIIEKLKGRAKH